MNLFVGNLSQETTDVDLRQIFSEFGTVVSARIIKDNVTGISRGFGFVEMENKFNGYDAIDNLDATFLQGQIISVKEAKPQGQQGGGGGRFQSRPGGGNRGGGNYGGGNGGGRSYGNNDRGGYGNNDRGGSSYGDRDNSAPRRTFNNNNNSNNNNRRFS